MPFGTNGTQYPAYAGGANRPEVDNGSAPGGRLPPPTPYGAHVTWTAPHPPPGGGPRPATPGHGFPPPAFPPAYAPPAAPRKRRTGLIVLLVGLALALVAGLTVAAVATLSGTKPLSDRQGRVTLTVPRTWSNDAGEDAGEYVDQGEESYTVPDIETGGMIGDFAVFIEPRRGAPLSEAHVATIEEECEMMGCISRGRPTAAEVNGLRGLEQVLRHPEGEFTAVLTVEAEALVVTVLGYGIEEDQAKVIHLMRTVVVNR